MEPQQVCPPMALTFTPRGHLAQLGSEKSSKGPAGRPRPVLKKLGLDSEGSLSLRVLDGRKANHYKQIGVKGIPSSKGKYLPF